MSKINFIVIKQYQANKVELYVFKNNGEESIYCISNGGIDRKNGYTQLKNLAEQNGLSYTSKGLRELRDKGLLYNMNEQEFNMAYEVMRQGNKNQANYQEERKQHKQLPQKYKPISDFFPLGEIRQESINMGNGNQETVPRREDDLDSSKLQEFSEKKREELTKDPNKDSSKKRGISYQLKRVAMTGIITAIIGAVVLHFGTKRNKESDGLTQNSKPIESTITPVRVNTVALKSDTNAQVAAKKQTNSSAADQESKQKKMKKATEDLDTNSQVAVKKQTSSQATPQESKQPKEKKTTKSTDTNVQVEDKKASKDSAKQVAKSENTQDNTRMTGFQYKARMTNFWPDDGYGTGEKTGSGKTIYDFQVNEHGWYTYQGKLVIGTGTPYLLKYGYTRGKGVRLYEYYDELTLTIDGKNYPAIVLDSCGAAMKEKRIDLYIVGERYKKDTTIRVIENVGIGKTAGKVKQKVKTR